MPTLITHINENTYLIEESRLLSVISKLKSFKDSAFEKVADSSLKKVEKADPELANQIKEAVAVHDNEALLSIANNITHGKFKKKASSIYGILVELGSFLLIFIVAAVIMNYVSNGSTHLVFLGFDPVEAFGL